MWLRFWGCNFSCKGFGQANIDDPSTWELPFETIDTSKYKSMEELPVFHTGCDSSYSWAKKFNHLAHHETADTICNELTDWMRNDFNPNGNFIHPKSGQDMHFAITGGEPMMNQSGIVDVIGEFRNRNNSPKHITIETNGTQALRKNFLDYFSNEGLYAGEIFWSCSPKLRASGEAWNDAINPEILASYNRISNQGQLKYVVDGSDKTWDEVERATEMYRAANIKWPVWIMPVGADREMQEQHQAAIAEEAVRRGYNVATRIHVFLFGNVIGK